MSRSDSACLPFVADAEGWSCDMAHDPSPNHDARPAGTVVDLLVIHNISLPPGEFGGPYIADLFGNRLNYDAHPYFDQLRALRVSAHFLIRRDGSVIQFVPVTQRAWHAGASSFKGRDRCNDFSIGIELEGSDFQAFEGMQYERLAALTLALQKTCPLRYVTGHQHIAPQRKTDPGPFFDWSRYHAHYLALLDNVSVPPGAVLEFPFAG